MVDVSWYSDDDKATAIWLMTATEVLLPGQFIPGPPGDDWTRVWSSDFSGDTMADLFWRNRVTQDVAVWLMNGTELFLAGPEIPPPLGAGWTATNTGDYNGDGMVDVFWHNPTTSSFSVTLMNATAPLLRGPALPSPLGDGWAPINAQEFNADGMTDMLWYNATTRSMAICLMAGTELLLVGPEIPAPPGDGWILAPAGDFNADGLGDVLWENPAAHLFSIWLMAGTEVLLRGPELPGLGGP